MKKFKVTLTLTNGKETYCLASKGYCTQEECKDIPEDLRTSLFGSSLQNMQVELEDGSFLVCTGDFIRSCRLIIRFTPAEVY